MKFAIKRISLNFSFFFFLNGDHFHGNVDVFKGLKRRKDVLESCILFLDVYEKSVLVHRRSYNYQTVSIS